MTDHQKKIVAILSTLFIVCACCGGFTFWTGTAIGSAIITDTAEMAETGQSIASYTLPEGYSELFALDFMGNKSIAFINRDQAPNVIVLLMQVPQGQGMDEAQFESQMRTIMERFNFQPVRFEHDKTESRSINRRETDITFSNGTDGSGTSYRQMSLFFKSGKGNVLMLAQGPESEWDQNGLNQLLDSLR